MNKRINSRTKRCLIRLTICLMFFIISQLISFTLLSTKPSVSLDVFTVSVLWIVLLNWPVIKLCKEHEERFLMKITKVSTIISLFVFIVSLVTYVFVLDNLLLNSSLFVGFDLWVMGLLSMYVIMRDYDIQRKEFIKTKVTLTFSSVDEMVSYFNKSAIKNGGN